MRSMVASLGVRSVLVWLIASLALAVAASPALAEPMFAVTGGASPQLWSFDSATPEAATPKPIGGLQLSESVLGLDARPATGQLYALGSTNRLYTINPATAAATQVGTGTFSTPIVGADVGFDFDPTADLVRVVSTSGQNMRLSPVTGNVADVDTNLAYAASDPHFGAPPNVDAAAYTNNFPGATSTTLYEIDSVLDNLVRQGSVGGSPVSATTGQLFTIGSFSPFATNLPTALDISSAGIAYASLRPAPSSDLYTVNLATAGAPTGVGPIGPEGLTITGLAVGLPGPALTPASANFGQEQVDDTTAPTTFTVTNNGSAPVHVGGVSVTGAFHSPSNNCVGTTLAPGASCPIQVVFSPRRLGTHNGTLTVHDNAAGTPPTASLTGDGVSLITLTPATGQFPAQAVGTTSAPIQFTLSNLSDAPVGITSILTTAQFPHSQTCGSVLGPLASCSIQVSFSPSSTGPMAGGLTVRSNAPTTETLHSTLAGSGFVPPLTVTVRTASSRKMARALRNGIVARVGCSKACRASAQLVLRGALPRARSAAVVVGRGSTSLTGQGSKRLTARFTAAARRALPRRKRARLSLRVSFTASPNQSARVRKSILLRR